MAHKLRVEYPGAIYHAMNEKGSVLDIDTGSGAGHSRAKARKLRVEYSGAFYHPLAL